MKSSYQKSIYSLLAKIELCITTHTNWDNWCSFYFILFYFFIRVCKLSHVFSLWVLMIDVHDEMLSFVLVHRSISFLNLKPKYCCHGVPNGQELWTLMRKWLRGLHSKPRGRHSTCSRNYMYPKIGFVCLILLVVVRKMKSFPRKKGPTSYVTLSSK